MKTTLLAMTMLAASMLAQNGVPREPVVGSPQRPRLTTSMLPICSSSNGYPCIQLDWTGPSCAPTVIMNDSVPPVQVAGPCIYAVLRCMGGSCSAATLPPLAGTTATIPSGALGTGNTWQVLNQTGSETTSVGGPYFDTNGLSYGGMYNYVVLNRWATASTPWSAYSNVVTAIMIASPGIPTTPTGVNVVVAGVRHSYYANVAWTGCPSCKYIVNASVVASGTSVCPTSAGGTYVGLNNASPTSTLQYSDYKHANKNMCYMVQAVLNGKYSANSQPAGPILLPSNK